ncbi:MAG: AAA family ATPase [Candidatus Omnitrophica bacterium]|nr:AAA family ATPase [Candidatus Omnitrophota bacterium]
MTTAKDKNYFLFLKELVRLEEKEENEEIQSEFLNLSPQERQLRGKALLGLSLREKHFSPAEHSLATFCLKNKKPLPLFTLETGDIVSLYAENRKDSDYPAGTVYEKTKDSITVAFHSALPDWVEKGATHQLHKSLNRATYRRMLEALDAVHQTQNTHLAVFRDISLGLEKPRLETSGGEKIRWFDKTLNASQQKAVSRCLAARDVALVHGPPGTGKTTALIEIIRQSLAERKIIFVTAPSNTACDNLLERLVACGMNALRMGHPARIGEPLREHTLDFKLALHPTARFIVQAERELGRLKIRSEINFKKQEIKNLRKEIFDRVMKEAEVIVGTPASLQDRALREKSFDLLVFDEATQATEPISWIPMTRVKKAVMAGDHFQLPPTVRSKEAEEKGLGVTLFERLYEILGAEFKTLLERQYRMNEKIMGFSSREFYDNKLVADESVRAWTLSTLPGVEKCAATEEPLVFIDTAGKGFEERLEPGSESRYNAEEAGLVLDELKRMLGLGVPPEDIAVISPYSAQVRLLASLSPDPSVEIDSVDGFQGREKELVIVSLVRSNLEGELGFLNDTRRMNVAMTRARRKLIVIGDGATLSSLKFYKDFMKYAEEAGSYHTAWE